MLLAQGRYWKISHLKGTENISVSALRAAQSDELKELRIDVPLTKWNRVVKHVRTDRKLLGGILLDFAKQKDALAVAIGNDRLVEELQRVVVDASAALIESGVLSLTYVEVGAD